MIPAGGRVRAVVDAVLPAVDGGRFAVKRVAGEPLEVEAHCFADGHDVLRARLLWRAEDAQAWQEVEMQPLGNDVWRAAFTPERIGRYRYTVAAWVDRFATWRHDFARREDPADRALAALAGAELAQAAAARAKGEDAKALADWAQRLRQGTEAALDEKMAALAARYPDRALEARWPVEMPLTVERARARFSSWYELFPRSAADTPGRHGTFADVEKRLAYVAELGFDVLYLPPIHPIGRERRKGRNNAVTAGADDVGSPWAIGNEHGGHDAIEPALGTLKDFDDFVAAARQRNMEVALDFALQCSPDHPWVHEHPDWFHKRPDGTIAYAENPPKKYQDIYPINFWCADRHSLWEACRDVVLHWVQHGVRTFRVDNPHTKPFAFWEWLIADVQSEYPDVIFFAEAFTRPKKMKNLAKLGFTMSYTYFTWKNAGWELREYLTELNTPPTSEYYRGNLFANTPDILNEYLVHGGRPAFRARLVLAGTLSPLYGIYSGFELVENVPVKEGSEEYLHSEKYEIRVRDWNATGNINADVALINRIRRETPALQRFGNLTFHVSENEQILFYRKAGRQAGDGSLVMGDGGTPITHHPTPSTQPLPAIPSPLQPRIEDPDILVAVNLDPLNVQATMVHVPLEAMGIAADEPYAVHDLITGTRFTWVGPRNYVRLDPNDQVAHVLRVER